MTPNNSFQPTSHSSLRSSCAAAELHRYASKREEVMDSRACSPTAVGRAAFACSRGANVTGAPRKGRTPSDIARAVPVEGLLQEGHGSVMLSGGLRTGGGYVYA